MSSDIIADLRALMVEYHTLKERVKRSDEELGVCRDIISETKNELTQAQECVTSKDLHIEDLDSKIRELQDVSGFQHRHISDFTSKLKKIRESIHSKDLRIEELTSELEQFKAATISKDLRIAELTSIISKIKLLTQEEPTATSCSSDFNLVRTPNSIYSYIQGVLKNEAHVEEDFLEKILLTDGKPNGNFVCGRMIVDAIIGKKEPSEYSYGCSLLIVTYDVASIRSLLLGLELVHRGDLYSKGGLNVYVRKLTDDNRSVATRLSIFKNFCQYTDIAFFDFEYVYDPNYSLHYKRRFTTQADKILPPEMVCAYHDVTEELKSYFT